MSYAGAARLHRSGDKSKSVANLQPKLSSHERWLTRGRLLLMNKVSVLRFGDHLFSSSALSLAVLSNIYEAQFQHLKQWWCRKERHRKRTRACSVPWLPAVYSFDFSFQEKFPFPRLKVAVIMCHMRSDLTTKTRWILNTQQKTTK